MNKRKVELVFKGNWNWFQFKSSQELRRSTYRSHRAKLGIMKDVGEIQEEIHVFRTDHGRVKRGIQKFENEFKDQLSLSLVWK